MLCYAENNAPLHGLETARGVAEVFPVGMTGEEREKAPASSKVTCMAGGKE